jgi:hypothetical protein
MFVSIHKPQRIDSSRLCVTLSRRDMLAWTGAEDTKGIRVNLYGNTCDSLVLELVESGGGAMSPIVFKHAHDSLNNSSASCTISARKVNAAEGPVGCYPISADIVRGKPILIKLPHAFHGDGTPYRRTRKLKTVAKAPPLRMPVKPTAVITPPKTAEEKLGAVIRIAKAHHLSFDDAIKLLPILEKLEA